MKKQFIILLVVCGVAVAEAQPRIADYVNGEEVQDSVKITGPESETAAPESLESAYAAYCSAKALVDCVNARMDADGGANELASCQPVMPCPRPPAETALDAVSEPESERWVTIFDVKPRRDVRAKSGLSVGVGAFYASDFGGGLVQEGKALLTMPYYGMGAYLFFDAIYAEVFIGYSTGGGKWKWGANDTQDPGPSVDMHREYRNYGILATYPFDVGVLRIFPLLGIDYEQAISFGVVLPIPYDRRYDPDFKNKFVFGGSNADVLSALWFKLGGGLDVDLFWNVYARLQVLYGFRTVNNFEKDLIELDFANREANRGHGLTYSIAGGVKF
jgi:hypothetical protein